MIDDITVVIPTFNEEKNIHKTLEALKGFKKIFVIDSYSTDKTIELVNSFSNTSIVNYKFDNYVNKINFCISIPNSKYTLLLDADYVMSKQLFDEIANYSNQKNYIGFRFNIYFMILNKPLTINIYPKKILLFKTGYENYKSKKNINNSFYN